MEPDYHNDTFARGGPTRDFIERVDSWIPPKKEGGTQTVRLHGTKTVALERSIEADEKSSSLPPGGGRSPAALAGRNSCR